jgi:glycosyltransferase involved in cell wall biosynthesis
MADLPLVSVLMPVWNGEAFLAEAIDSVLAQTLSSFELIVVNDGSLDRTGEIVARYEQMDGRVRSCSQQNQGASVALNQGLMLATGKYVARLDADDVCLPDRLARQVELLERDPNLLIVGSAYYLIDEAGQQIDVYQHPGDDTSIRWKMLFHNPFCCSSVTFRAEVLRRYGMRYDPHAVPAEDFDMWSRLLEHGRGANLPDPLLKYRIHPQQLSSSRGLVMDTMATRISKSNLARLGLCLPEEDVRIMRQLYNGWPQRLTRPELRLCRQQLRALELFARQPDMVPEALWRLHRIWLKRLLLLARAQPRDLWAAGLLNELLQLMARCPTALAPRRVFPIGGA